MCAEPDIITLHNNPNEEVGSNCIRMKWSSKKDNNNNEKQDEN